MIYKNSQILAAVVNKWIQPAVTQLAGSRLQAFPVINAIDNKIRSLGWVSPNWSITAELAPIVQPITASIVEPMLRKYISNIPDEAIPEMAHGIVDKWITSGGLNLMEGRLVIEPSDLQELKKLLDYNLPLKKEEHYEVKLNPPTEDGTETTTDSQPA